MANYKRVRKSYIKKRDFDGREHQKHGFASKKRWKPTSNKQSHENHSDFLLSTRFLERVSSRVGENLLAIRKRTQSSSLCRSEVMAIIILFHLVRQLISSKIPLL